MELPDILITYLTADISESMAHQLFRQLLLIKSVMAFKTVVMKRSVLFSYLKLHSSQFLTG